MSDVLAHRIKQSREAMNPKMTQRELAKRLDRSPSAINLWEKGTNEPGATEILALSKLFNVSTDWLMGASSLATRPAKVIHGAAIPTYTVPVVSVSSLIRWHWEAVSQVIQTAVAYPDGLAAAILVSSDAMATTCPTNSFAVILKGHLADSGQIVLAALDRVSEPVLRKFVREGGHGLLVADDMRYPSYSVAEGVKILGRVVEVIVRRTFR